ncbi:MAG: AtpZ/AtpI family protein [Alphaproteobacteria bacterium]|nr:AtpZ/AtpI family protein [Alphaproteobacteria bacterium]
MNDESKLKDLQAQIDALKTKTEPKNAAGGSDESESMSVGMRAGTELVGATVGSALIGYGLDSWLGTKPWFLIIIFLLGVCAAFLNIWKITENSDRKSAEKNLSAEQKKSLAKDVEPLK